MTIKRTHRDTGNPHPAMQLTGVLSECWRNLVTGTTHACGFAMTLMAVIVMLCGADLITITRIQKQVDDFVSSGGSTYVIEYAKRINPVVCESLSTLDGVREAGAVRQASGKITFAALPSTGVPAFEVTEGAIDFFTDSTGDVSSANDGAADMHATNTANDAKRNTRNTHTGIWLSAEAALPLQATAGESVALKNGGTADIGGIYQWPDDGRKSGYSYAVLEPVPANDAERFDSCLVKAWPVPDNIESLLRLATVEDAADSEERPVVSRLNTSQSTDFDPAARYRQRITAWAPAIAAVAGLMLGATAIWLRRLELASALHCGVPKYAVIAQIMMETAAWAACAIIMSSPILAWIWSDNTTDDAAVLADTMLRVPIGALLATLGGTFLALLTVQERKLFRYFKNR